MFPICDVYWTVNAFLLLLLNKINIFLLFPSNYLYPNRKKSGTQSDCEIVNRSSSCHYLTLCIVVFMVLKVKRIRNFAQ